MRNQYKRDINRLVKHPRRLPSSRALRNPGGLNAVYSEALGLTRSPGNDPITVVWQTIQREGIGNSYELRRTAAISVGASDITVEELWNGAVALFNGVVWFRLDNDIFEGSTYITSLPTDWVANDLRVVNNAVSGNKEIWVSGIDASDNAVIRVFNDAGGLVGDRSLASSAATGGGYIFMSASPNYYAFGTNNEIGIRRVSDNTTVLTGSWCDTYPHEQTGLIDITDELVVWGCSTGVVCRTLPGGLDISPTVDSSYLAFDTVITDFTRMLTGVQLSNESLTVFGANRYIHYKIDRNESGAPVGFTEISRQQFSDFENYNAHLSTDRSLLNAITPV